MRDSSCIQEAKDQISKIETPAITYLSRLATSRLATSWVLIGPMEEK